MDFTGYVFGPKQSAGSLFPGLNESPLFLRRSLPSWRLEFYLAKCLLFGFADDLKLSW